MSYLERLRGIINEINIGNDAGDNNPPAADSSDDDTSDEGNENFMDNDDNGDTTGTDDSSDTSDENEGNENFIDNDDSSSDDNTTDDSSDTSDEGDENFMDDDNNEGDDESQPSEEEDSSDDEGGNENFMDSGDDTSDEGNGEESGNDESQSSDEENSDDSNENDKDYDINKIEDELFSSLTPEQIAIKNHELKNQFIELYSIIGSTLVRINDISKTNENINVLKFITEKLLELREMVDFNVTTAYQTRTYIENNIIYQQCIATLNAIADIIENIPKLNNNDNKVDDEEIENKGELVEKDEETSDFLNVSDSGMSDYQEESTDYNTLF